LIISSALLGMVVFGLVLILAGVWLYLRSRNSQSDQRERGFDLDSPETLGDENVDTLLDAILALDDQYKAGEIPQDAYLKRREELKASIKDLLKEEEE